MLVPEKGSKCHYIHSCLIKYMFMKFTITDTCGSINIVYMLKLIYSLCQTRVELLLAILDELWVYYGLNSRWYSCNVT